MKVVISGYYGFDNSGEEAILFSMIQAFKKVLPSIHITVLSNDPEYTRLTYGVDAVHRRSLIKVIGAIKRSDGFISGGGSLLQDETGNRNVFYYSALMMLAKFLGKPFVVYAQGIGPICKKPNEKIVEVALNKAKLLTVRDVASKQLLEKIGVLEEINLVPDPVLGIEIDASKSKWLIENDQNQNRKREQKFISVSVRDWTSGVSFLENIAAALDMISRLGYKIIFVPMHGEHDEKTSKNVQDMMTRAAIVAPADLSIEEKIKLIGESELLIGMRLHALIFAAIMDTPFTAISYDPKIDAFASLCQQPVPANVNEANWSSKTLFKVVKEQLNNLPQHTAMVKAYTKVAKLEAQRTAELALTALDNS